jgi:hypothetical protein
LNWFGFGDRGLVPSWLVFPATKTQSDVLGHSSAPHRVGLSLVRPSNLREESARDKLPRLRRVTARSASERRPTFDFRYRLEISLAVSPRLRFIRLNTGTRVRPVQHNGTATFLAWSAKNLRNSRNRTLGHAVGRPVVLFWTTLCQRFRPGHADPPRT